LNSGKNVENSRKHKNDVRGAGALSEMKNALIL
jgi:hypothetical protein